MTIRPYVTLNIAISVDGKTDTVSRKGAAISSPNDMERVDRLRADNDAVMVGGHTLLGDDPRLTVKSGVLRAERLSRGLEENPIKVGIITNAILKTNNRFMTTGHARKIIFTTNKTNPDQISLLRNNNVQVHVNEGSRVDLKAALQKLKQGGVEHLLVEGGGTLNEELLKQELVDEINVYSAPLLFGGSSAPTFMSGKGLERHAAIPLQLTSVNSDKGGGILARYIVGNKNI